ncbi:hypothetical protein B566_EDAN014782 [Ephemera danica]|nr:hypothetical protein B566_EDAN014782 [Ephemera danica]
MTENHQKLMDAIKETGDRTNNSKSELKTSISKFTDGVDTIHKNLSEASNRIKVLETENKALQEQMRNQNEALNVVHTDSHFLGVAGLWHRNEGSTPLGGLVDRRNHTILNHLVQLRFDLVLNRVRDPTRRRDSIRLSAAAEGDFVLRCHPTESSDAFRE